MPNYQALFVLTVHVSVSGKSPADALSRLQEQFLANLDISKEDGGIQVNPSLKNVTILNWDELVNILPPTPRSTV